MNINCVPDIYIYIYIKIYIYIYICIHLFIAILSISVWNLYSSPAPINCKVNFRSDSDVFGYTESFYLVWFLKFMLSNLSLFHLWLGEFLSCSEKSPQLEIFKNAILFCYLMFNFFIWRKLDKVKKKA